jgi:hypothetical protein
VNPVMAAKGSSAAFMGSTVTRPVRWQSTVQLVALSIACVTPGRVRSSDVPVGPARVRGVKVWAAG